jgi:hypothetical protein
VAIILMRTLKADFARFTSEDSDDLDLEHVVDESGWKHVHGMCVCGLLACLLACLFGCMYVHYVFRSHLLNHLCAGDVFRAPPYLTLYSALIGTGHQFVVLGFALITFTILGTTLDEYVASSSGAQCPVQLLIIYISALSLLLLCCIVSHYLHRRGMILTSVVVLYCLTSIISGYVSTSTLSPPPHLHMRAH